MKIKGYTVHYPAKDSDLAICGVRPGLFFGQPAISFVFARLTCPKCESLRAKTIADSK